MLDPMVTQRPRPVRALTRGAALIVLGTAALAAADIAAEWYLSSAGAPELTLPVAASRAELAYAFHHLVVPAVTLLTWLQLILLAPYVLYRMLRSGRFVPAPPLQTWLALAFSAHVFYELPATTAPIRAAGFRKATEAMAPLSSAIGAYERLHGGPPRALSDIALPGQLNRFGVRGCLPLEYDATREPGRWSVELRCPNGLGYDDLVFYDRTEGRSHAFRSLLHGWRDVYDELDGFRYRRAFIEARLLRYLRPDPADPRCMRIAPSWRSGLAVVSCATPIELQRATGGVSCRDHSGTFFPTPLLAERESWYAAHLRAAGKGPLCGFAWHDGEAYRFTWLRTFHEPIIVTIARMRGLTVVSGTVLDGAGGYAPGDPRQVRDRDLDPSEWDHAVALIERTGVWLHDGVRRPEFGVDGAQWIIEAVRDGRYSAIDVWTPQSGADQSVWRAGMYLVQLADVMPTDRANLVY